jgi:hypothetical protein
MTVERTVEIGARQLARRPLVGKSGIGDDLVNPPVVRQRGGHDALARTGLHEIACQFEDIGTLLAHACKRMRKPGLAFGGMGAAMERQTHLGANNQACGRRPDPRCRSGNQHDGSISVRLGHSATLDPLSTHHMSGAPAAVMTASPQGRMSEASYETRCHVTSDRYPGRPGNRA